MKDWCLEVWGDYACFTRPEMKVERVSYDVMTPSAARAIFEAILWKPAIRWHITSIEVLAPIRWISVRRTEVGKVFSTEVLAQMEGRCNKPLGFLAEQTEYSRSDETEAKYAAMFGRRARKGQCFHRPYLGCREFACDFRLVDDGADRTSPIDKTEELGWMLYDMDFNNPLDPKPEFFRARIEGGIINTDRRDPKLEVRG